MYFWSINRLFDASLIRLGWADMADPLFFLFLKKSALKWNRALGVILWLSPLIQLTSVCTKPPQTQSLLHYIRTLPVNSNGTLLLGTYRTPLCKMKWIKPRLISHMHALHYTHTHTHIYKVGHTKLGYNRHLWKDAHLWGAERNHGSHKYSSNTDTDSVAHPPTNPPTNRPFKLRKQQTK